MLQHREDIESGPLTDTEWTKVNEVMNFLRVPWQVMEALAADRKSSLDLVRLSIAHLTRHCETNEEQQLKEIHTSLSANQNEDQAWILREETCAVSCNCGGVLVEPSNPKAIRHSKAEGTQGHHPSPTQGATCWQDENHWTASPCFGIWCDSLWSPLCWQRSRCYSIQGADDEGVPFPASNAVDWYLRIGVVHSQSFIDVIQWCWKAWIKHCLLIIKWPWTTLDLSQPQCHLNGFTYGRAWVYVSQVVYVIGYFHQNHVPAFTDESASHRPSKRSSVGAAKPACCWFPRRCFRKVTVLYPQLMQQCWW